jgi:hypothetical protein
MPVPMRFLAVLPLAALALSCSSKAEPVVSGGAQFRLQNALPADRGTLGACPENQVYTVAQRGEDGQLKLVVNGADDARVECAVENGRFNISVSRAAASFSASGSIVNNVSSNADVTMSTPSNTYTTLSKKCTVTFTETTGGKLRGKVKCPLVEHKTLSNACSTTEVPVVDADGVDRTSTFFAFANCNGV